MTSDNPGSMPTIPDPLVGPTESVAEFTIKALLAGVVFGVFATGHSPPATR